MEDKRITKTKRALKSALLELLTTQAFDVISITELCKIANVSRITFYTHYKDKFALLDDIFNDMLIIGPGGLFPFDNPSKVAIYFFTALLWKVFGRKVAFFGVGISERMGSFTMNVMIFSGMSYRRQILTWLFDFIGSF